jgi:glycosyltransferase involved in cell wall biosynthesis
MVLNLPFISVVTPVYNGERYLAECIQSVLGQDYKNFEYIIVDNCSNDATLDIANHYAKLDSRIGVITNSKFVNAIENHNIAVSLISLKSKYCKVVSADDWIKSDCIIKMVTLAEKYATIGIVGSYQRRNSEIRWRGLPENVEFISGREVCRLSLLENLNVFGTPTSSLYNADLIRKNTQFYPHTLPHADTSACYKYLRYSDFGFVHEDLSIERVHPGQISLKIKDLGANEVSFLEMLVTYGPIYLNEIEFTIRKKDILREYYRFLGGCLLKLSEKELWKYQECRLAKIGYCTNWREIIKGAIDESISEMKDPKVAFRKFFIVLKNKLLTIS